MVQALRLNAGRAEKTRENMFFFVKNHDTVARGSASLTFVTYVMYVKYIASTLPKIGQLDMLKTLEIVIFFRTYQNIHLLRLHLGIIILSTKQTS